MSTITEEQMKWVIGTCNQIDPRTQMNMPTLDLWVKNLSAFTLAQVQDACDRFYSRPWNSPTPKPVIDPANLRRDIRAEAERESARDAALEAPERIAIENRAKRERVRRTATPEYQAAKLQGAVDHLAKLEERGIIKPDQQKRLDHHRATGQLEPADDPVFA